MLEVGVRCLRLLKAEPASLNFKRIIFQFCGIGKVETVRRIRVRRNSSKSYRMM